MAPGGVEMKHVLPVQGREGRARGHVTIIAKRAGRSVKVECDVRSRLPDHLPARSRLLPQDRMVT